MISMVTTSLTAFGSITLEVVHRHEKVALESGVEFSPMVPISGACVRGLIKRRTV